MLEKKAAKRLDMGWVSWGKKKKKKAKTVRDQNENRDGKME